MSQPPLPPAPPAEPHPVHRVHGAHAAEPVARAPRIGPAGNLLYVSATMLASLWAVVLLFVVYPRQPLDTGYADDDVPVVSPEGNVVTVKHWQVEEAIRAQGYMAPSDEQVRLFAERRAETIRDVKRDKLIWFMVAAAFPGAGLLVLRLWFLWKGRG